MTPATAIAWLEEAARYFAKRPTDGEDMAHWSNMANAEACRKIAALIARPPCVSMPGDVSATGGSTPEAVAPGPGSPQLPQDRESK